jgi:hypothetical protein
MAFDVGNIGRLADDFCLFDVLVYHYRVHG